MTNVLLKSKWFLLCILALSIFTGCQNESLFDPDQAQKGYEDSFVVKDVSQDMDWKTTTKATVSITVDEDNEVLYTVQIFDKNPLIAASNAKLLTSGYAKTNQKFETEIDYPTALNTVYVCRVDEQGRRIVRPVAINNGAIATSFVGDVPNSAQSSRSIAMVVDVNKAPYSESDIKNMLEVATEFVPGKILDDIDAYPKNYLNKTISVIKLSGDYSGSIDTKGVNSISGTVRLIITGKWTSGWTNINQGVEIIVANDGTATINNTFSLNERSSLTIMPGGTITGAEISCNALAKIFNSGTISLNGSMNMSKSTFVNATGGDFFAFSMTLSGNSIYNQENAKMTVKGTIKAENSTETTKDSWFTNYGTISANQIIGGNGVNINNSCRLFVADRLETSTLNIGPSASVECNTYRAKTLGTISMGSHSVFYIKESAELSSTNITGPTDEWALLKIKSISSTNTYIVLEDGSANNRPVKNGYIINKIYCEIDDMKTSDSQWQPSTGFDFLLVMINGNGNVARSATQNKTVVGNGQTTIAKFGEAPLFIPASDCTPGNTPTDYVPPVVVTPITYTYAFEDMFPSMGDYDFNDVVMDVKWDQIRNASNAITSITYHVTLAAVGATKELGAGLRLYDVSKSIISSITYGGDVTSFRSTLTGVMFYPVANNLFEGNNTDVVIPLFDDAHKVLTGATDRTLMLNTGNNKVPNADTKTLDITITFNTPQATVPISKENLDFFIAYNTSKQVPTSRNEIHLYEFRDRQSPVGMDNSQYIAAAGNCPWAISVPEFHYPIELTSIISAYDGFASWAQAPKAERQQYEDWYKTVSSDQKVFR